MTDAHEPDDDPFASAPRYPAPGRPERPAHRPDSPWPWVAGAIVLAVVGVVVPLVVFLIHLLVTYDG
ncbi:hypothetical protein IFT73_11485 [Aeromicrobium sp. CFBP 8757]|uniref:hypothetical protein n=1 Tax=Aeromicrobium sp. CFBP 8757 TaxID=2775288 RepID=UPI0017818226|nr:hypothetical protein [Aeromicrobium sp. CFBP 8757]MBD8607480.1 hypothetical protein [Aeromicrobium sp. CFBP 8757]